MEPAEDLKELVDLFEGVRPEQVVFWTGAGISCASPTNLPDGDTLTVECMKKFMPADVANYIKNMFEEFYKKQNKKVPRLELIIQNIYDVLGQKTFHYFDFMNIPDECLNSYHSFFAQHILAGGTHFTMNFDNGIEKRGKLDPPIVIDDSKLLNQKDFEFRGKLIKLHGSLSNEDNYSSLGLILRRITGGFGKEKSRNVLKVIEAAKVLCFIGYGGRDAFDVTPFFLKHVINGELKNRTIVWIKHAENKELKSIEITEVEDSVRKILEVFYNSGARVCVYKGNAECGLIPHLTDNWEFERLNPRLKNMNTNSYQWIREFDKAFQSKPIQHYLKKLIAGECAQSLGLGQLAVDCTKSIRHCNLDTHPSDGGLSSLLSHQGLCWFIYTDGLRNLGKFDEAIDALEKWIQIATKSSFDDFLINARLMGDYRLRLGVPDLSAVCKYWYEANRNIKLKDKFTNHHEKEQLANDFIARLYVDYLEFQKSLWDRCHPKQRDDEGIIILFKKFISKIYLKRYLESESEIVDIWVDSYYYNNIKGFCNPHTNTELQKYACIYFEGIGKKRFIEAAEKKPETLFDKQDFETELCVEDEKDAKAMHEIEAFLETDSLLGVINSKRWLIDMELNKNHYDIEKLKKEINKNICRACLIHDYGVWMDYLQLVKVYKRSNELGKAKGYAQKALDAMKEADYGSLKRLYHSLDLKEY